MVFQPYLNLAISRCVSLRVCASNRTAVRERKNFIEDSIMELNNSGRFHRHPRSSSLDTRIGIVRGTTLDKGITPPPGIPIAASYSSGQRARDFRRRNYRNTGYRKPASVGFTMGQICRNVGKIKTGTCAGTGFKRITTPVADLHSTRWSPRRVPLKRATTATIRWGRRNQPFIEGHRRFCAVYESASRAALLTILPSIGDRGSGIGCRTAPSSRLWQSRLGRFCRA